MVPHLPSSLDDLVFRAAVRDEPYLTEDGILCTVIRDAETGKFLARIEEHPNGGDEAISVIGDGA